MREKLMDGRRVATRRASAPLATLEKRVDQRVVELVNVTSTTNEPLIEMSEELQLGLSRRRGVTARGEMRGKRVEV